MSAVEVGLVTAVALLLVMVTAVLRAQVASSRKLEQLERRLNRADRRSAPAIEDFADRPRDAVPAPSGTGTPDQAEGDAVDVEGVAPDGSPVTVRLEVPDQPVLLVFLSTTCGICTSIWEQLRDEGLPEAPGMRPVVVTKDAPPEDLDRIRAMETPEQRVSVVLSSEAWIDYEVPGSPYLMVVDGRPGSVVDEGSVSGWDGVAAMVARLQHPQQS